MESILVVHDPGVPDEVQLPLSISHDHDRDGGHVEIKVLLFDHGFARQIAPWLESITGSADALPEPCTGYVAVHYRTLVEHPTFCVWLKNQVTKRRSPLGHKPWIEPVIYGGEPGARTDLESIGGVSVVSRSDPPSRALLALEAQLRSLGTHAVDEKLRARGCTFGEPIDADVGM